MAVAQNAKCSECKANVAADAMFCSSCGTSFRDEPPAPVPFEYMVIKAGTHDEMTTMLNQGARIGWEPVNGYAWHGGGMGTANAVHACLLRRPIP